MPSKEAADCLSCGGEADIMACSTCVDRLGDKGTIQGICATCIQDDNTLLTCGSATKIGHSFAFSCRACVKFIERCEQEKLSQKLQGPNTETILRTVANKYPWTLTIAKASNEELLEALQFLKRKLSGLCSVHALAE